MALIQRVRPMGTIHQPTHLEPLDQPSTVQEIAQRLFPAYQIGQGSVHLAGCRIENRPFIRFSCWLGSVRIEVCLDENGRLADSELVESLRLNTADAIDSLSQHAWNLGPLQKVGLEAIAHEIGDTPDPSQIEVDLIWCKYAHGKLQFTFGDGTVELPFEGWTSLLSAPRFVCPYTGESTFELASTDDGRIAAASAVRTCDVTGETVLTSEGLRCSATGKWILNRLATQCPITGEPVWRKAMVVCAMCRQEVSPLAISRGRCDACRHLRTVAAEAMPLRALIDANPMMRQWGPWRMAETAKVYIVVGTGWVKRLLLVIDRDTLQPIHTATAHRLLGDWTSARYEWSPPSGVPRAHFSNKPTSTGHASTKTAPGGTSSSPDA